MKLKTLDLSLDVKEDAIDEAGVFNGYGSVFGNVDKWNEIVERGACKKSLKKRHPAMLWQHMVNEPIGAWLDIKEDDYGLHVIGQLALDVTRGKDAYGLLKIKALRKMSIGFIPIKYKTDKETGIITLTEIDLWEISLVTFAANDLATVDSVKSFFADGIMPTERECEEFLRDAGLSRTLAKTFLSKGYRACLRDADKDENKAVGELTDQVKSLLEKMNNGRVETTP